MNSISQKIKIRYLYLLFPFLFFSCSPAPVIVQDKITEIKYKTDTIKIIVPERVSLLDVIENDSLEYKAENNDILIKYYPKIKKIYVKQKQDTVKLVKTDTITITKTKNIIKDNNNINYYLVSLIILLVIFLLFQLYRRR